MDYVYAGELLYYQLFDDVRIDFWHGAEAEEATTYRDCGDEEGIKAVMFCLAFIHSHDDVYRQGLHSGKELPFVQLGALEYVD